MSKGLLIGRLFGTDIHITLGHLVLLALFYIMRGSADPAGAALFCFAVVVSILVHEFGHVFAVKWWLRAESIVVLHTLGGLCLHPRAERPGQQVGISLMGPAFGLVLGLIALAVALVARNLPPFADALVADLIYINFLWTALNLIPILPLDGGQALRAGLAMKLHPVRAGRIAHWVSIACILLCGAASVYFGRTGGLLLCGLLLLENLGRRPVTYH